MQQRAFPVSSLLQSTISGFIFHKDSEVEMKDVAVLMRRLCNRSIFSGVSVVMVTHDPDLSIELLI